MAGTGINTPRGTASVGFDDLPIGHGVGKIPAAVDTDATQTEVDAVTANVDTLSIPTITIGVQVGSTIPISIAMFNLDGTLRTTVQRLVARTYDGNMKQELVAAVTMALTGGTLISNTAQPALLFDTSAGGLAALTITDVVGAGLNFFLEISPVSTSTDKPGFPRIVAVSIT